MRLQQVLLNYQSNAIKFTNKNGKILIRITRNPLIGEEGIIKIEVIDNGAGIRTEDQTKLFKLFGYLDSTKEMNSQGIGLGLYITKMIVEQFEGEVGVKSEVGKGAAFKMTFKLSKDEGSQKIERRKNPKSINRKINKIRTS